MIDIVITWLDSSNHKWQKEFAHFKQLEENVKIDLNDFSRYRDYGSLKYWFRMIEKNVPWVNKIHIVTADKQIPDFLNLDNERINVVHHSEIIDSAFLPTFNSSAIMVNIHKIPGLQEKFILFNDDMFVMNYISKEMFFSKEGLPCDSQVISPIYPDQAGFSHIILNNMTVVNNHFSKKDLNKLLSFKYSLSDNIRNILNWPLTFIPGFYDYHLPTAYTIDQFNKVWNREKNLLIKTSSHKFRKSDDVTEWLIRYWRLCENNFSEVNYRSIGKLYELNDVEEFISEFKKSKIKIVCLNDSSHTSDYDKNVELLLDLFDEYFPNKSSFEV